MTARRSGTLAARETAPAPSNPEPNRYPPEHAAFVGRVLAASGDCIRILDLDARPLFVGDSGPYGPRIGDIVDGGAGAWLDCWQDDARADALAAVRTATVGGVGRFQALSGAASDPPRWWDVQITPISGTNGRPEKLLLIARDVTGSRQTEAALRTLNETLEALVSERTAELMAAEASLRQSQKMEAIGQLAGGIAHDFNNMLQAIAGCLDVLELRLAQGQGLEAARYLDGARTTVARAGSLTHRLLAFASRQLLQPQAVDTNALIESMAELIGRAVGTTIAVELSLAADLPSMLCDPGQIENVLLNLAINARDAMPEGGRLAIATHAATLTADEIVDQDGAVAGAYVGITVSDSGVGIAPEVLDRVFEPFFTTKPPGKGTGLGLSQLHGFIRQSKGVVRLESRVGHGTSVRLYLPCHPAPADAPTV